jgi:hypothetical protein
MSAWEPNATGIERWTEEDNGSYTRYEKRTNAAMAYVTKRSPKAWLVYIVTNDGSKRLVVNERHVNQDLAMMRTDQILAGAKCSFAPPH